MDLHSYRALTQRIFIHQRLDVCFCGVEYIFRRYVCMLVIVDSSPATTATSCASAGKDPSIINVRRFVRALNMMNPFVVDSRYDFLL